MKKSKAFFFWIASFTWGLPMTLIGILIAAVLLITGHKPKRFCCVICFEIGGSWGGFSCGPFIVVNKGADLCLKRHEFGHSLQNIILGVFMPFIISIPSMVRYWYRKYLIRSGKKRIEDLTMYESIWFESWATRLGNRYLSC